MLSTNLTSEDGHQRALITWVDWNLKRHPELAFLFAIPNGGYRTKTTAALLKATGVKKGVPDLMLAWPTANYHGLFIEMKRPKKGDKRAGVTSKEQLEWLSALRQVGYRAERCDGFDAARALLLEYLA